MYITQGLKRAVQLNGQSIATIDGDRQQSWQQFADRVARLAGAFQDLDLNQGDRIAILSLNSDRYLEVYYAVPWFGGVIVPLNTRLAVPELVYMLNDAGATCLLVDDTFAPLVPELQEQLETVRHFIHMGEEETAAPLLDYETLLTQAEALADAERGGDALAAIFYTGGTTGQPKGVMLSHTNFVAAALGFFAHIYTKNIMTYLHSAPMFHIADAAANIGVTLSNGTHVMMPRFDPNATARHIQDHQITHVVLIPTMLAMMVEQGVIHRYELSSLELVIYGGAPMPERLIQELRIQASHCEFMNVYGLTESCAAVTFLEHRHHSFEGNENGRANSVGRTIFHMEVRITEGEGREVAKGEIGEIAIRGPKVMLGYWNKPEETARSLRDDWLYTGDLGYMDEDGFVYIVDRLKDMIITGGENVYSSEVENVLYHHPAVATCAVIGIPHTVWGEQVHAIIVPQEGQSVTLGEIIDFCKGKIAGYKCPRSVEIRSEPLPISGAGKIQKAKLRETYTQSDRTP